MLLILILWRKNSQRLSNLLKDTWKISNKIEIHVQNWGWATILSTEELFFFWLEIRSEQEGVPINTGSIR